MIPILPLSENAHIIMGQSPPGQTYNFKRKGTPLLNGPTEFGPVNPTAKQWTTAPTKLCKSGDILFCVRGATTGRINVADGEYCLGRGLAAIRAREGVFDSRFLTHVLSAGYADFQRRGVGSTFINISSESLAAFPIPSIALGEQRRIAAILDQADALRAKRRAALEQLDKLASSLFVSFFGDAPGRLASAPTVPLAALISEGPQNGLYKASTEYGSGTKILRIDAFYDGVITKLDRLHRLWLSDKEVVSYGLKQDDIIVNRVNSIEFLGKSAIVPKLEEDVVFESNIMRLSIDRSKAEPAFVVQALQMPNLKAQIARSAKRAVNQASINQQDVMNFQVPCPPLDQQRRYVKLAAAIGKNRLLHAKATAETNTLFASLQHRAFRGEL